MQRSSVAQRYEMPPNGWLLHADLTSTLSLSLLVVRKRITKQQKHLSNIEWIHRDIRSFDASLLSR